jgi:hypothetical protein
MNTEEKIALERHRYMEGFLAQFLQNGMGEK